MPPLSYLFIDGGNLNAILRSVGQRYFRGAVPTVNWANVRSGHQKVYYYDAVPVQSAGEEDGAYAERIRPKLEELKSIERQPSFHVRSGDAIHRKRRGNEQKMVDVQLAVDALRMAHLGLFSHLTLLTSDLDFKPLVDALVDMGVQVTVLYPRGETNEALTLAADFAEELSVERLRPWLEPQFNLPTVNHFVGNEMPRKSVGHLAWDANGDDFLLVNEGGAFALHFTHRDRGTYGRVIASSATGALHYAQEELLVHVPSAVFEQAAKADIRLDT